MPYACSLLPVSSASLSPRLTLLSLALPPSALTPFLPAQDTNPSTPPATRHQLTPLLVSRGIRLYFWNLTATNTNVRLLNGGPNIETTLAPRQPSILYENSSTTIPPGVLTCSASCLQEPTQRPRSQNASVLGSRGPPTTSTEPHSSRLASNVVCACLSGPKIPTAHSVDRSWTSGGITHWSAAEGVTELFDTT